MKDKEIIMDDLDDIIRNVNSIGFKGSNEFELHLRDEIADYILKFFIEK